MITDTTQRWIGGRDVRRPAGEPIRTSEYEVASIATWTEVRDFVRTHHYAGEASSTAHHFELYRRGELVGVALFGPPASSNAHHKVWGDALTQKQAVTLGRFVLRDEVPGNGESWFGARCFELLRDRGVRAVESCADPEPRTDVHGRPCFRGHLGTIYQALNARYVGKTNDATLHLLPDGSCLSNRAQRKLRDGEKGAARPVAQLVAWGATPLVVDEDPVAWLQHWRARICRTMRHRGCHRYLWALSRRDRGLLGRHESLPYPKDRGATGRVIVRPS